MVGVERDDDGIRTGLPGHVDKELIARAFGFEPDGFDAQ
jgi:hypothetical protein